MEYIKRDPSINNFTAYVQSKLQPNSNTNEIPGMSEAADIISNHDKNTPICIVGDYDADGIMSLAIFSDIMIGLHQKYFLVVPKRFSEGYGLSQKIIDRLPDNCMLILVDNGITAVEPIAIAKQRGMKVLVFDHHKTNTELPDADLIIDPEVQLPANCFHHYCGAGLACKLAEKLLVNNPYLLNRVKAYAAVATVADVVPMIDDNRRLVREGLEILNSGTASVGLTTLSSMLSRNQYEEEDISYKLAPAINAPGRLLDNGGELVVRCMISLTNNEEHAAAIINYNNERKRLTEDIMSRIQPIGSNVNFVCEDYIPLGLCGPIAGKLVEMTHKPTLVATKDENGIIKGSARSTSNENIYDIMSIVKDKFIEFGGHAKAAGFSFKDEDTRFIIQSLNDNASIIYDETITEKFYYDFEIPESELFNVYRQYMQYHPYGADFPNPIIKTTIKVVSTRVVGKESDTLQLKSSNMRFIGFGMADDYEILYSPNVVTVYGVFSTNYYENNKLPQIRILHLASAE